MIISRLKGGLGNQMFQYAFGKYLSHISGQELKLDLQGYKTTANIDTPRQFGLSNFNIQYIEATDEEIKKYRHRFGLISRLLKGFKMKVLKQHPINFESKFYNISKKKALKNTNLYLDGFFQSEEYFKEVKDLLKDEFKLKKQINLNIIEGDQIRVMLHVRRGDYISNIKTRNYHGTCDIDYYQKAINTIEDKIQEKDKIVYMVISDDIEWSKNNITKLTQCKIIFISDNVLKDYEELSLMTHADHFIIANSSFSWWIAWLGENEKSIVIAPNRWTAKISFPKGPVPERWIKIL